MDALISSALEEICKPVHRDGIALSSLCSNLNLGIDCRRSLWSNLLKIPAIKFKARKGDLVPIDSSIQGYEDAEKLGLEIVAGDQLRDSYLGLYDVHLADSKISDNQHHILERIAMTRTSGITNIKLAEELKKDKKSVFYDVKKLESRCLIVKQRAVERNKGGRDRELNNNLGVNTNLLHLYRYAKHLRSQEKFVITKDEDEGFVGGEDGCGEDSKEDVLIHDIVPEMKAICDKLKEAEDKVLSMSDIKHDLGYHGKRFKHRTVRSIFNRLIRAGIVEKFDDTVNGKNRCCLRLLKEFSLECFGEKSFEANTMKFGRSKTNDQFVELPLQHHIYDMVEAAGSEGLLFKQVEKRLGIDKKKNCSARDKITRMFGLHREIDVVDKAHAHRVWTPGNSECLNVGPSQSENLLGQGSSLKEMRVSCSFIEENINVGSSESLAMSLIEQPKSKSSEKDPSQTMTLDAIRREQKILKQLQDEKVIFKPDLYKWLLYIEKHKSTIMDRKTLNRILNKLETEGKCKLLDLVIPSIRNCDGNHKTKVVLHPFVQSSSPELLDRIGEVERFAAMNDKGCSLPADKSIDPVLVDGVQRTQNQVGSDSQPDTLAAMCANGFIVGKMVRAKLLHNFLWGFVSSSPDFDGLSSYVDQEHKLKGPAPSCYLFDMKAAINVIPVVLFLQIVGSAKKIDDIVEKCMGGLRLSDLPLEEYDNLKDNRAMRRLSSIVSILQQLKMIRLVNSGPSNDGAEVRQITLQYALELCPYIEEPLPTIGTSSSGSPDGCPRIRHNFFLSNKEAIDKYWQILEHFYATADPRIALLAFPGSAVNEVFRRSSWALVRATTPDRRTVILKRMAKNSLSEKNLYEECKKIAQDLSLTMEQVLDVYNDHGHYNRSHGNFNANGAECQYIHGLASRKRKRKKQSRSVKRRKIDCVREKFVEQSISDGGVTLNDSTRDELFSIAEHEISLQTCWERDHQRTLEKPAGDKDNQNSIMLRSALLKRKPTRRRRFSWADGSDRELLIQYVRHLVFAGKNSCRTYWASLSDLPAPSRSCQRKMATLMHNRQFKESLWELCDMLRKQYEKERNSAHKNTEITDGSWLFRQCLSVRTEYNGESGLQEEWCDDSSESEIKLVFEEVLRCMKVAIVQASRRARPVSDLKFPTNTGTIAAKFTSWLHESKEYLTRGGVALDANLKCGHILHLFGLVSTSMLSITLNLPVEGVGEAEDIGSSMNTNHITDFDDGRRVKGFPGIKLCVQQTPISRVDDIELSADREKYTNENIPHKSFLENVQGEKTMDVDLMHRTTKINECFIQGTTGLAGMKETYEKCGFPCADGTAEVLGVVMQNPGILEDDIVSRMTLMDRQHCKRIIKKMVQDNILVMRKMFQNEPSRAPTLLGSLVKSNFEKPKEIYREHFFANPTSSSLL